MDCYALNDQTLHLQAKEVAFDALFDLLPINFSWMDRDGCVLGCNRRVLESLHLQSFDEIIGKHTVDIASELAWQNTQKVVATGQSLSREEVHLNNDGSEIYFLSLKSPLKSPEGRVLGVVNIAIDITDRKKAEKELGIAKEAAEVANHAKSEFLNNMRHDLRTPFTGILGLAQLMEAEETDPDKKESLGYIVQSADALLEHLNEIFEFVQVESGQLPIIDTPFDLHQLLSDLSKMMLPIAKDKKIDFTITKDNQLPQFPIGDRIRIQRILMNLVSNAIKFTPKGHVKVQAGVVENSEKVPLIYFKIEDTGIGIPQDKCDLIFERFHRLTPSYSGVYSGKGLGLRIVKQFLDEIGGEFHLGSVLEKGTTFTVLIPHKPSLLGKMPSF